MADQNSDFLQMNGDQDNSMTKKRNSSNGDDSLISSKKFLSNEINDGVSTALSLCSGINQPPNPRPQSPSYPPFSEIGVADSQPIPIPTNNASPATTTCMTDPFINSNHISPSNQRRVVPTPRTSRLPPRARRNHTQSPREENKTFPPPYPWATNKRATVLSLHELKEKKIDVITGLVQCRRCERQYEIGYNLVEKFKEIGTFMAVNKESLRDRAPTEWRSPVLLTCKFCEQENSVKPVISGKKKTINWLFLLLGKMLGCCTLAQLKYFCKHTRNHRTGAKDRVLYLTYLELCKQLAPHGPFDL